MGEYPVKLWLFDLSNGLARQMSMAFIGTQLEGVWHTSVVVYGREHFFGGEGISAIAPGTSLAGSVPYKEFNMGNTCIPPEIFYEYIEELRRGNFAGYKYDLFEHNCNNFSDEICHFLVGEKIPAFITSLPKQVLQTPFGQMIKPMFENLQPRVTPAANPGPATSRSVQKPSVDTKTKSPAFKADTELVSDAAVTDKMVALLKTEMGLPTDITAGDAPLSESVKQFFEDCLDAVRSDSSILIFSQQMIEIIQFSTEKRFNRWMPFFSWLSSQNSFLKQLTQSGMDLLINLTSNIASVSGETSFCGLVMLSNFSTDSALIKTCLRKDAKVLSFISASLLDTPDGNIKYISKILFNLAALDIKFFDEEIAEDNIISLIASLCQFINNEYKICEQKDLSNFISFLSFCLSSPMCADLMSTLLEKHIAEESWNDSLKQSWNQLMAKF